MTGAHHRTRHLLVIALMALGLVGMHHLIVAACNPGQSPVVASESTYGGRAATIDHSDHPETPQTPDRDLGATCLAILAFTGALLSVAFAVVTRVHPSRLPGPTLNWIQRALPPPKLSVLSISRT